MTKDIKVGGGADEDYESKQKQEFRFTIAFGYGFITLMFLAFLTGYFLGKHIFGLSETSSLIMSLVVGITSIIIETILFIIKMERLDA
jgi:membrane protein DedA with SNARE-associated domain